MLFFEKVNPAHPDKLADRIAGAIGDIFYKVNENAKWAIEVLLGHGKCLILIEASDTINDDTVREIVHRVTRDCAIDVTMHLVPQDKHLSANQLDTPRCGDNGIFKGHYYNPKDPLTLLTEDTTLLCKNYYSIANDTDGKIVGKLLGKNEMHFTVCQSNLKDNPFGDKNIRFNPLGFWTGGLDVDSGATNRKLGSDMGEAVTGGGLHGKDLTKADTSINIYLYDMAQIAKCDLQAHCAIGDKMVEIYRADNTLYETVPFGYIVSYAKEYVKRLGGFEKFAEWGLIRPSENWKRTRTDASKGCQSSGWRMF